MDRLHPHRSSLLPALTALAGTVALAVTPGVASAATVSDALAGMCPTDAILSQPFAPWGDANEYRVMPGGSFSDGAPGWTLSGGAFIAPVDDPFNLADGDVPASLSLPPGGSARSPFTCVDSTQPTVRFVDAARSTATLTVRVVYELANGTTVAPTAAVITPGTSWSPSPIIQDGAQLAGALSGGTALMALDLTATGGPVQIDDVFVDPHMHWG